MLYSVDYVHHKKEQGDQSVEFVHGSGLRMFRYVRNWTTYFKCQQIQTLWRAPPLLSAQINCYLGMLYTWNTCLMGKIFLSQYHLYNMFVANIQVGMFCAIEEHKLNTLNYRQICMYLCLITYAISHAYKQLCIVLVALPINICQ